MRYVLPAAKCWRSACLRSSVPEPSNPNRNRRRRTGHRRNGKYDNTVALLVRMAGVMNRIGASAEFARRLDAFRFKYKAKRNFIKLLDRRRGELSPT